MSTLLITAELPEHQAKRLADALMEGEHHLPIAAAGAFEGEPPVWRFEAWSSQPVDKADFSQTAARFLGIKRAPDFFYKRVNDTNWVAKSLEDLPPVRAGRFVMFGAHDRDKGRINDIRLEIEASLAFGTGHHPTTLGCLLELDRVVTRDKHVRHRLPRGKNAMLDIGTGTGVLALAVAKALHVHAIAGDCDTDSLRVAARHCQLAGMKAHVTLLQSWGTRHNAIQRHAPYPLVVANILAEPLVKLAPAFARVTQARGTLILSGLLAWQAQRIEATYRAHGFSIRTRRRIGDWTTLVFCRK